MSFCAGTVLRPVVAAAADETASAPVRLWPLPGLRQTAQIGADLGADPSSLVTRATVESALRDPACGSCD